MNKETSKYISFPKPNPEPMEISMLESDWLAPRHPFRNLDFVDLETH